MRWRGWGCGAAPALMSRPWGARARPRTRWVSACARRQRRRSRERARAASMRASQCENLSDRGGSGRDRGGSKRGWRRKEEGFKREGGGAEGGSKRRLEDDGQWWLPVDTPPIRRTRWPSSPATRRGRAGMWARSTDPWMTAENLKEHVKHKGLWKELKLTYDAGATGDEPPGSAEG